MNQTTNVWVVATGNTVTLYLNNSPNPESFTIAHTRVSGPATLYVSSPWHTPALARIGSIQMTPT